MEHTGLRNLSPGASGQVVRVRISRLWCHRGGTEGGPVKSMHMVLIDAQAEQMHAIVPYPIVRSMVDILFEGNVYEISRFSLVLPRSILRPVEASYAMILGPSAVVKRDEGNIDDFPSWSCCLTSIVELPLPDEVPERFVDVLGTICAVSDIIEFTYPGRMVNVARRDVYIMNPSGEQRVKVALWGEGAYRFNAKIVKFLGQTDSAVVVFVGTTAREHNGQRSLAGGTACRWYINEDFSEINILRARMLGHSDAITDCPVPLKPTLRVQVGEFPRRSLATIINFSLFENKDANFRCTIRVLGFKRNHPWVGAYCMRCRRSSHPHPNFPLQEKYMCTNPNCDCETTQLRYQIALIGTDGTDEAEFILRAHVADRVVGISILELIRGNLPPMPPQDNSFRAADHIPFPYPQFGSIISNRYKFIVQVREGSFYRPRPSFDVMAVEAVSVTPKPLSLADLRYPASSSVWAQGPVSCNHVWL